LVPSNFSCRFASAAWIPAAAALRRSNLVAGGDADVAALARPVSLAPAQPQYQPLGAEA
jgi:hypothetical protein